MKKHIGSTIALVLGILYFASALTNSGNSGGLVAGPVLILGALAYRSAKKRKLGEANNSTLRKWVEVLAMIVIAAAILLQNNLKYLIATDPISNLIIPLWAIIANIVIASMAMQSTEKISTASKNA
jgi:hypothetical protein